MKNCFIIIVLFLFPIIVFAQNPAIDELLKRYSNAEDATIVDVTPEMLYLLAGEIAEGKDFENLLESIKSVRILTIENKTSSEAKKGSSDSKTYSEFKKDFKKNINSSEYTKLMEVKEGGNTVQFLIKKNPKNQNNINEFLMVAIESSSATLIYVVGDIELKKLMDLSKSLGIKGLEGVKKFKK